MNSLHQLQSAIDNLTHEDLPRQKQVLLTLLHTFTIVPSNGNGNGNGNGSSHASDNGNGNGHTTGNGNGNGNGNGHHQRLSPREREVMDMILSGRRLKEIAAVLDISVKTVTTHRSRLLRKLNLEDNLGLYRYGIRNGLIGL